MIVLIYISFIIIVAIITNVNIYKSFSNGVKESFRSLKDLFPSIIFFVLGVNIFLNSGVIDLLQAFCERLNLIPEVIIQLILRPVSNSSSMLMMINIFEKYGVDSFLAKLSSVIQASSDTTIYMIMIYFSSIGIKRIGNSLLIGIFTNIITFVFCLVISYIIFNIF